MSIEALFTLQTVLQFVFKPPTAEPNYSIIKYLNILNCCILTHSPKESITH